MKQFYISDLHLGHKNILKHEDKPYENVEEMLESYIWTWNNAVNPEDNVYILGDFSFYKDGDTMNILKRLNGRKFLIRGNHDSKSLIPNGLFGFTWIRDLIRIKDNGRMVVLCHYPMAVWEHKHHGAYHLYGHIHSNKLDHHPMTFDLGDHAFNVGIDVIGRPMTLDELIEQREMEKAAERTFGDKYGRD